MKWIKNMILNWLTKPETMQDKNKKFLDKVEKEVKKATDIKYTDDPVTPGFIGVSELSDMVFDENVVMFVVGKKNEKWNYFARYLADKESKIN